MGNVLLVIVGALMIGMIVLGMKKGLVKMLLSFASFFVIILLVNLLNPLATELLSGSPVYDSVYSRVDDYVADNIKDATASGIDTGVKSQENIINSLALPNSVKDQLIENNNKTTYAELEVDSFTSYITSALTDMIINAIAFILLFIVITILVKVLVRVLNLVTKLPVIHEFNAAGGALVGLVESLIIIWVACIVLTMFTTTSLGQDISKGIAENEVLSFIYDHNVIKDLLFGWFK